MLPNNNTAEIIPSYQVVDDQNFREIKVLVNENPGSLKIFPMDVPFLCAEEDILTTIYPDHKIYKEDFGYKLIKTDTVLIAKVTEMNDFGFLYHYRIDIDIQSSRLEKFDNFGKFWNSEKLSDVSLCIKGRNIHAHKIILANKSPVFEAMFTHEMMESQNKKVEIDDIDYDAMYEFVRYIYTGKLNDDEKNYTFVEYSNILIAANKYCVDCLKIICETKLSLMIRIENVLNFLVLADSHNAVNLRQKAINFIVENVEKIIELPSYKQFVESHADISIEIVRALIAKQKSQNGCGN